ncbi:hypothetical protein [Myroides marinus]|uniref:hypothetical protein n=1 Tax=Myroides marinus TaxID=703342 RepID=UPI0025776154|nr:hypothetical protein [Myroides marinus]MDM1372699.1 hypothetical protein [Myroides marinus]
MKKIIAFFSIIMLFSCSKAEDELVGPHNFDLKYTIELLDNKGNNLLDPKTPNYYQHDKVQLLVKTQSGTSKQIIFSDNTPLIRTDIRNGKSFYFLLPTTETLINNESTIYLSLPNGDLDKITLTTQSSPNNKYYVTKKTITYNDKIVWDKTSESNHIVIIK